MSEKRIIWLISIILILIIAGCANQMGPQGGDIDTIPPEILATYPADGALNFSDNKIIIEFSEYVRKETVYDAIFISPKVDGEMEFDWSGTTLTLIFDKPFKENTTYVISIGTGISDINQSNKMVKSKEIHFSTGTTIDYGTISGTVFEKDLTDIIVFAYKNPSDTLNPVKHKPDYVAQPNSKGNYYLPGLGKGIYRLFAIRDRLKDLVYNVESDDYGCTFEDVELKDSDTLKTNMDFFITREDTTAPDILSLSMPDEGKILVEFTEQVDSTKLTSGNFSIVDSTAKKEIKINLLSKNNPAKPQFLLSFNDSLKNDNQNNLVSRNLIDRKGNIQKEVVSALFVSTRKDTTKPTIKTILGNVDQKILSLNNAFIKLTFSENVICGENAYKLADKKKNIIKTKLIKLDDANFRLDIEEQLKAKDEISLSIDLKQIKDLMGNKVDSVFTQKLNVEDGLNYSSASGSIKNGNKNNAVVLKSIESERNYYQKAVSKFNFDKVKPGKYMIWYFTDSDSSDSYSYGKVFPYMKAEKFQFYSDTLKLRARWPVGEIILENK